MFKKLKYFIYKKLFSEYIEEQKSHYFNIFEKEHSTMIKIYSSKISYIHEHINYVKTWSPSTYIDFFDPESFPNTILYYFLNGDVPKFPDSSEVEQVTVNHSAAGSIPALGAK
jgi:hypothetical protein